MGSVAVQQYSAATGTALGVSSGTLRVTHDSLSDDLLVDGIIAGLAASAVGGWHIHKGFSCDAPGDPYVTDGEVDPWARLAYIVDANGVATVRERVRGYSLVGGGMPVLGHALVVHDQAGAQIGCGVIQPLRGEAVLVGSYPGYHELG